MQQKSAGGHGEAKWRAALAMAATDAMIAS
jgi:hypothetical protein